MSEERLPAHAEEEKKGFLRFMEVMDRDGVKFLKSGALVFLTMLPFMFGVAVCVANMAPILLLGCIPCGMFAAPQIAAAADTVMRSLRDEIGWWWWDTYKTVWKRNLRASLLPGAIFGFLMGAQIYSLYMLAVMENPISEFWMLMAALLVEFSVTATYLPMLVCIELPFPALVRNCFVLFFSHPIKSLTAGLVTLVYYILILIWFPLTSVIFLLTSVWLPMLISYMVLYPVLDKHFNLKESYELLRKAHWEAGEEVYI